MSEPKTVDAVETVSFNDNRLMAELSGEHDAHLMILEEVLGVRIDPRGNRLSVSGRAHARAKALKVLENLYRRLERGEALGPGEVRAAAKLAGEAAAPFEPAGPSIRTPKRQIAPRTANQRLYLEALGKADLVFADEAVLETIHRPGDSRSGVTGAGGYMRSVSWMTAVRYRSDVI